MLNLSNNYLFYVFLIICAILYFLKCNNNFDLNFNFNFKKINLQDYYLVLYMFYFNTSFNFFNISNEHLKIILTYIILYIILKDHVLAFLITIGIYNILTINPLIKKK